MVINISTIAEGVGRTEGGCHGSGGGQDVPPGIVGVLNNSGAAGIKDGSVKTIYLEYLFLTQ